MEGVCAIGNCVLYFEARVSPDDLQSSLKSHNGELAENSLVHTNIVWGFDRGAWDNSFHVALNRWATVVHALFGVAQPRLEQLSGKLEGSASRPQELLSSPGHDKQLSNEL